MISSIDTEIELGLQIGIVLESLFSKKSLSQQWLESDHVTQWCLESERVRLQEEGHVIGGLS